MENTNNERKGSRWLRLGVLTFTLAGPLVNAVVERVRERSQILRGQAKVPQEETLPPTARQRLDQLNNISARFAVATSAYGQSGHYVYV
jgi:hypothetical protein